MSHIYITNNGSTLSIDGGRYVITQKNELIRSIPKESVESISIFGNSSITTPCIQKLLDTDISVSFFSNRGNYYGRLESTSTNRIETIVKQIEVFDNNEYARGMSRQIIAAKINNQEVLLRRYSRNNLQVDNKRNINMLKEYRKKITRAETTNEIMGYEGIAARLYFESLSKLINPDFAFTGRNRRPPKDKFNSLLSLGYTLLMYEIYGKIQQEGLTPYYSILHKSGRNHPVLASDLMEEWRSTIVDSTVLSMVQGNEIVIEDFECGEDKGIYLTNIGMKKFLNKFERKLATDIKYLEYDQRTVSMRQALNIQCQKLKESVDKKDFGIYKPILLK